MKEVVKLQSVSFVAKGRVICVGDAPGAYKIQILPPPLNILRALGNMFFSAGGINMWPYMPIPFLFCELLGFPREHLKLLHAGLAREKACVLTGDTEKDFRYHEKESRCHEKDFRDNEKEENYVFRT